MTRSELDALKWRTSNIAAGGSFIVPSDKIYEVYIRPSSDAAITLDGWGLASMCADYWCPAIRKSPVVYWSAAEVIFETATIHTLPQGWILSDGNIIATADNTAFTVRWRDVTEQQLGY